MTPRDVELRAVKLRYAVLNMAGRYGEATQQYAYALGDRADVRMLHLRAAQRRYRALMRLTAALSDLAAGGAR